MPTRLSTLARRLDRRFRAVRNDDFLFPESEFSAFATELFRLQFELCAPYHRLCLASGVVPDAVRDWREIPAAPTLAFRDLALSSIPAPDREFVFHSSGTTGHRPSQHFHHRESRALYETSLADWFASRVLNPPASPATSHRPRFLSLTPPPVEAPHSSLVHMLSVVAARFGSPESAFVGRRAIDGAWEPNPDQVRFHLEGAAAQATPVLVLGTAFNFVHLLDLLDRSPMPRPLPPGSRVMETGGYKGRSRELDKADLHAALARALGVPQTLVGSEYGMSELGSQAYDRVWGDPRSIGDFQFPPWVRVLTISPETGRPTEPGQVGLVRILDLANVWSVMAIQTADLGVLRGDRLQLLGRAPTAVPRGCSLMAA